MMMPGDHFPDGKQNDPRDIFGMTSQHPGAMDHDHIIGGGPFESGIPGLGSSSPESFMPKMPKPPESDLSGDQAANDPSGLPGNPQFRPNLPVDISKAMKGPGVDNLIKKAEQGNIKPAQEDAIKDVKEKKNKSE